MSSKFQQEIWDLDLAISKNMSRADMIGDTVTGSDLDSLAWRWIDSAPVKTSMTSGRFYQVGYVLNKETYFTVLCMNVANVTNSQLLKSHVSLGMNCIFQKKKKKWHFFLYKYSLSSF